MTKNRIFITTVTVTILLPLADFLTADPIRDDFENSYRYVNNNPVNNVDPSGLMEKKANYLGTLVKYRQHQEAFYNFLDPQGGKIALQLQIEHQAIAIALNKSLKTGVFSKSGKPIQVIIQRMIALHQLTSHSYQVLAEKHTAYRNLFADQSVKARKSDLLTMTKDVHTVNSMIGNLHKQHALAIAKFEIKAIVPLVMKHQLTKKMLLIGREQLRVLRKKTCRVPKKIWIKQLLIS